MRSDDPLVRRAAVALLGDVESPDTELIDAIRRAADDEDAGVRDESGAAIVRLTETSGERVARLVAAIRNGVDWQLERAVEEAARRGESSVEVVEALVQAAPGDRSGACVRTLACLNVKSAAAIDVFERAMRGGSPDGALAFWRATGRREPAASILRNDACNENPLVAGAAMRSLREMEGR
jgi:HEAT repeat protein